MAGAGINVGDVVQLKSGGPTMTVDSINEKGYAICSWFDQSKPMQQPFPVTSLQPYVPRSGTTRLTR